jgi:hypothetical protein
MQDCVHGFGLGCARGLRGRRGRRVGVKIRAGDGRRERLGRLMVVVFLFFLFGRELLRESVVGFGEVVGARCVLLLGVLVFLLLLGEKVRLWLCRCSIALRWWLEMAD